MPKLAAVIIATGLCTSVIAQEPRYALTGNDLLRRCDGPYISDVERLAFTNFCQGYLQGVQQMHHVIVGLYKAAPLYCEPTATGTYEQLQRVVVKWLKSNPEQLHRDARLLVTRALMDAFPCAAK